jgi:hypothetical protein
MCTDFWYSYCIYLHIRYVCSLLYKVLPVNEKGHRHRRTGTSLSPKISKIADSLVSKWVILRVSQMAEGLGYNDFA